MTKGKPEMASESPTACEVAEAVALPDAGGEGGVRAGEDVVEGDRAVSPEEARDALARVLASREFSGSPRLASFLTYVVETTLAGRADEIKGYTIAVEALGRSPSFDPQSDPIVRVEATRLRRALQHHFASAGADDAVEIVIPKGGYVPQFIARRTEPEAAAVGDTAEASLVPAAPAPEPAPALARLGRSRLVTAAGVAFLLLLVLGIGALIAPLISNLVPTSSEGERLGLPVVAVGKFEIIGQTGPENEDMRGTLHAIETRLRDAFAHYDFVDVKAPGSLGSIKACGGAVPRAVFAVDALTERRPNGAPALMLRVIDRCDETIVWSHTFEDVKAGDQLPATEQRVVSETMAALMDPYGLLRVRARAHARAAAVETPFGCFARAFSVVRGEVKGERAKALECLAKVEETYPSYGLSHAVRAQLMLDKLLSGAAPKGDTDFLDQLERESDLATDLAPTSAYASWVDALVNLATGQMDAALSSADQARKLNPFSGEAEAVQAIVLIASDRIQEGEALLARARAQGVRRMPFVDAYLGLSAYLRDDQTAAAAVLPALIAQPNLRNNIAKALVLHTLGRRADELATVAALATETPGGAEAVRQAVRALLPASPLAERVTAELEAMGLSRYAERGLH